MDCFDIFRPSRGIEGDFPEIIAPIKPVPPVTKAPIIQTFPCFRFLSVTEI
ncbi:unknown protein [Microcystis aeruginosa NIES-843]|uniref:Uncharacterized protein n=1 Tax=Microcystis aeruginosa (strain NIES-843 / IAM M-2473) TaxID=449447 RepID=B0JNB4_MICAN|nr:unknown protein [Microcystis aeruginosa NIES-843]